MTYHFSDMERAITQANQWFHEIEESIVITQSIYGRNDLKEYHLLKLTQTRTDDLSIVYRIDLNPEHRFRNIQNCIKARDRLNADPNLKIKYKIEKIVKVDEFGNPIENELHQPIYSCFLLRPVKLRKKKFR